MKALRLLRDNWVMIVVAIAILVGAAFAPVVQTWIAQLVLAQQTGVQATVGGFQARFGELEVHDLNVKAGGAVLTVPSLDAGLPLTPAALGRGLRVRRLVAKGWTLDLSGTTTTNLAKNKAPADAGATGGSQDFAQAALGSAEALTRFLRANLGRWTLPRDVSLDSVDLEGDVVLPLPPIGGQPRRLHLAITGGGLAAGHEGTFTISVSGNLLGANFATDVLAAQGRLTVAMATPRTLRSVAIKADFGAGAVPGSSDWMLSGEVAAQAGGDGTFSLSVARDGRAVASMSARLRDASDRPEGTWMLDLTPPDATAIPGTPALAARGKGDFDADPAFARVHLLGHLDVATDQLGTLAPELAAIGPVALGADFDATLAGPSLQVARLETSLAATAPIGGVRSLQAFDFNVSTGALKPADPAAELAEVTLRRLPLAWLPASAAGLTVSGGDIAGLFRVRMDNGGLSLRATAPLTVGGVSVRRGDRLLAQNLDLSASVDVEKGAQGLQVRLAPLEIASGGSGLATFKGSVSVPSAPDQPPAIKGTWSADLAALAARAAVPDLRWVSGRSASGDLTLTLDTVPALDGTLAYVGGDPNDTLSAEVHAQFDGGRIDLRAPLKAALGAARTNATIETTLIRAPAGDQFYLKLTGDRVALSHLQLLVARLTAAGIVPPPAAAGVRDRAPFWGDWTGRVLVQLSQFAAGDRVFDDVAGVFDVGRDSVRFSEGRGRLGERRLAGAAGSLSFAAAGELPYHLTATASLDQIEATGLFPPPAPDRDPVIEGRFAITGTVAGDGVNLGDLIRRVRESMKITSTAGAVRFLKTDVDEAIPHERQTAAGDTLGRMGAAVGNFLGAETDIGAGLRTVRPATQAAIDVINAVSEIAYDEVSLTAVREADGTFKLDDIKIAAPDLRITGSGRIGHVDGRALRAQPVDAELQVWAQGRIAKLLAAAGLLSDRKDDHGYSALKEPIRLRGTLDKIDTSQWHELLVQSAKRQIAPPKPNK